MNKVNTKIINFKKVKFILGDKVIHNEFQLLGELNAFDTLTKELIVDSNSGRIRDVETKFSLFNESKGNCQSYYEGTVKYSEITNQN